MNVLEFWGRIFWGILFGVYSAAEFSGNRPVAGIASLISAFVTVFSPFAMRRNDKRPTPLSALKNDFDIYMLLAWNRGLAGLVLAFAANGMLYSDKEKQRYEDAAAYVVMVIGWFLLSPLSEKVFTYPRPDRKVYGKWRMSSKAILLYIIRFSGVMMMVFAAGVFITKDAKLADGIYGFVVGVVLLFIRQIKHFLTGSKPVVNEPALAITVKAPVAEQKIQPEQPTDVVIAEEINFAKEYKELQLLPAAEKGAAYGAFLSRLFDKERLLTSGAFTVKEAVINGSFELDGQIYILAAKWGAEKSDEDSLLIFNARVESRSTWARGIFISEAGFTKDGLAYFAQGKRTSIIGMDGYDLQLVLNGKVSLADAVKRKARRAVETNSFFVPLRELI